MYYLQRLPIIREYIKLLKLIKSTKNIPSNYSFSEKETEITITLSVTIEKDELDHATYHYLIL